MDIAISWAEKGLQAQEVPVGAVLVYQNRLIAAAHNGIEAARSPLAHAELKVLWAAQQSLGTKYLCQGDLYVTLEPCAMCAYAIGLSRVRRLYFGAYDPKGGGVEHGGRVLQHPLLPPIEIIGGVRERVCSQLLRTFFHQLRGKF